MLLTSPHFALRVPRGPLACHAATADKAACTGTFEVLECTPPRQSLGEPVHQSAAVLTCPDLTPSAAGVHQLHPLTTTGDVLELDQVTAEAYARTHAAEHRLVTSFGTQRDYVVSAVVLHYKLRSGKYQRDHNRLEVQKTGRWLLNQHLEQLLDSPS